MYRIWLERTLPELYAPLLSDIATVVGTADDIPNDPLAALGDAEAIIAGGRLDYDAGLMDRAPQLRVISRTGIGVDKVAVAEATARGIAVCNAPTGPTISTAEQAIALMFAVAKQLKWCDRAIHAGGRLDFFTDYDGLELGGACLGLIGLGRIGSRVAKLAQGIGMNVVGFDPFISSERACELGIEFVASLDDVLHIADVVSLHVPLMPATHHLINAGRLAQMKRGSLLINTARGGLIDEDALLKALDSGHIYGAGLDVVQAKPVPPNHPLMVREDVIITPHIATATRTGKDRLWRAAIAQALQVLQGQRPPHLVNPEVWPR